MLTYDNQEANTHHAGKRFGISLYQIKFVVIIIWGSFEGMVLLRKWSVILVFYCLVFYCVTLVCCVCLLVRTLFLLLFL